MSCTKKLIELCDWIVTRLIVKNYSELDKQNAFTRVNQNDFVRVLDEYGGTLTVIPPQAYETDAFRVYTYEDGSGFGLDLDLWIDGERSDLTMQLDVKVDSSTDSIIHFQIDDLHVM